MRKEYEIEKLNPKENPYAKVLKQQITIKLNVTTIDYFKELSAECGVPYQTLINIYLDDCAKNKKKLHFA